MAIEAVAGPVLVSTGFDVGAGGAFEAGIAVGSASSTVRSVRPTPPASTMARTMLPTISIATSDPPARIGGVQSRANDAAKLISAPTIHSPTAPPASPPAPRTMATAATIAKMAASAAPT